MREEELEHRKQETLKSYLGCKKLKHAISMLNVASAMSLAKITEILNN